jgi:hypothetical protein
MVRPYIAHTDCSFGQLSAAYAPLKDYCGEAEAKMDVNAGETSVYQQNIV